MMKKFLLAGACLAALTGPAFATTWAECNKYQEPYWVQIRPLLGKLAMQEGASPQAKCSPETIAMARKAASLIAAAEATPVVKVTQAHPKQLKTGPHSATFKVTQPLVEGLHPPHNTKK